PPNAGSRAGGCWPSLDLLDAVGNVGVAWPHDELGPLAALGVLVSRQRDVPSDARAQAVTVGRRKMFERVAEPAHEGDIIGEIEWCRSVSSSERFECQGVGYALVKHSMLGEPFAHARAGSGTRTKRGRQSRDLTECRRELGLRRCG